MGNIFIEKKEFEVKRIDKTPDGWIVYPRDDGLKPCQISNKYYQGKMPPFFKWPWQTCRLKITCVDDFILSAAVNDIKLFQVEEDDYPPEVKKMLERGERMEEKADALLKKNEEDVRVALAAYLPKIPLDPDLEDKISALNICLRTILKANLLLGEYSEENRKRLNLMFLLFSAVQRVYERHVDDKARLGTTLGMFKFTGPFPSFYTISVSQIEDACGRENCRDVFRIYYEIEQLFSASLPILEDGLLRRYLNYTVQNVLSVFSCDYARLQAKRNTRFDGTNRFSDEEEYRWQYKKMELPKYPFSILMREISAAEFEKFVEQYSLR